MITKRVRRKAYRRGYALQLLHRLTAQPLRQQEHLFAAAKDAASDWLCDTAVAVRADKTTYALFYAAGYWSMPFDEVEADYQRHNGFIARFLAIMERTINEKKEQVDA